MQRAKQACTALRAAGRWRREGTPCPLYEAVLSPGFRRLLRFTPQAHVPSTEPRPSLFEKSLPVLYKPRTCMCPGAGTRPEAGEWGGWAAARVAYKCLFFPSVALSGNPRKAYGHPEADSHHWGKTARK